MLKRFLERRIVALIVSPLLRRLGTAFAVYLAARGVPADSVDQLLSAIGIIVGIMSDIVLSAASKQATVAAVRRDTMDEIDHLGLTVKMVEPGGR